MLNIKKSPEDKRDHVYRSGTIELPEVLDYREDLMPVRNQGSQGSCFAQSVACMKEWQEMKDYGFCEYFSPQFFYNNRSNKYDEDKNNDEGMFGRDVMKLLKNIGICKEYDYNYGRIEHRDEIPEGLYVKAQKHVISAYARIYNMQDLKESLYANGPALICFPVYNHSSEKI